MAAKAVRELAVAGVVVLVVVSGAAVLGFGLLDGPSVAELGGGTALTPQQVDDAVAAAHWAEDHFGPANIIGATAVEIDGSTVAGELGSTCGSGLVLEVNVYGSFPHVSTGGRFIPNDEESQATQGGDTSSTAIVYLDGTTARRCLHTFETGSSPIPGAKLLFGEAP